MDLLEQFAKQGWTITITFVDGFYVDTKKGNSTRAAFHAAFHDKSLPLAIADLLSKILFSEIPPEK